MLEISDKAMKMIREGAIWNHMLSNTAGVHTGTEEKKEMFSFCDYLITQNGCIAMTLGRRVYNG